VLALGCIGGAFEGVKWGERGWRGRRRLWDEKGGGREFVSVVDHNLISEIPSIEQTSKSFSPLLLYIACYFSVRTLLLFDYLGPREGLILNLRE
jgi:hypothetical protein